MNLALLATLGIVGLLFGLLLLVCLSIARPSIKYSFVFVSIAIIGWLLTNASADVVPEWSLLLTRLAFAFGAIALAALAVFVNYFPSKTKHSAAVTILLLIISAVIAGMSLSPLIVPSVNYEDGYANVVIGSFYGLYVVYAVVVALTSIGLLLHKMRTERGINKERIRYVLLGVGLTAAVALSTNLLLPLITGSNPLAIYGSFATLILIAGLAYTIIQHHLFSIHLATARAMAYILSGIVLGGLYGFGIFALASFIFGGTETRVGQKIFYASAALAVGLLYSPLKNFFDKVTQKFFLRNLYDPQMLLTGVAQTASEAKTSHALMADVTKQVSAQMYPSFIQSLLLNKEKKPIVASHAGTVSKELVLGTAAWEAISSTELTVITPDDEVFQKKLKKEDIGAIVVLKTPEDTIGCMLLGYKLNGTTYTKSDLVVLEAISDEVAIAAENLLRYEAIQKFSETLQDKVDKATAELRRSNAKLMSLDEAKDEFISMASHQLRTPLTSVKGYVSMVLEGDAGKLNPQQRKLLEEAYSSSQRMVYLIGDFLNVSRLKTGKFMIEKSSTDLAQVVREEVEQLEATAKARQLKLRYDKPADFPEYMMDSTKLRQVIMNFIDNAIYYSRSNGTIDIQLTKSAHDITFKVKDTGIGVPASERPHLFTKFFRATNARKARPDGTGIGLFMAKKVIVAHHGAVIFESKENVGSTFGFRLPLAQLETPKKLSEKPQTTATTAVK